MNDTAGRSALAPLDEDFHRVLATVAHPDDLEYGTSAAVDRWTAQGKTVSYLLATRGEAGIDGMAPDTAAALREQEERDGAAVVGVEDVRFLAHADGVVEYSVALRADIARVIRQCRPEIVIVMSPDLVMPWGLNQADHRAVGLAALDACRDAGNRWIHREQLEVEGLAPWSPTAILVVAGSAPTHYVDVTGHLEQAVGSLAAHVEYNRALTGPMSDARAVVTGALTGGAAALGLPGVEHAVLFTRYAV